MILIQDDVDNFDLSLAVAKTSVSGWTVMLGSWISLNDQAGSIMQKRWRFTKRKTSIFRGLQRFGGVCIEEAGFGKILQRRLVLNPGTWLRARLTVASQESKVVQVHDIPHKMAKVWSQAIFKPKRAKDTDLKRRVNEDKEHPLNLHRY